MHGKGIGGFLTVVLVALGLVLPTAIAVGAAGPGGGGGSGGGGSGGGGGQPTDGSGSLYSDLTIVLRAGNGTPILKRYDVPADADSDATTEYCVQPISYESVPGLTSTTNPVDGRSVTVLPLQGEWIGSPDPLPVAEIEPCDAWPQYAMFVSEVEMERLNLARTADEVIARKIADVQEKLFLGGTITLASTGRILIDDKEIDASPENAAIYQSLMTTGTIPGLPATATTVSGPPAMIGPEGAAGSNSRFDAWELAAIAIGAAASKSTPLTIDAVEYYNRIIGFPPAVESPTENYVSPWGVHFVQSEDPRNPGSALASAESLVDYTGFSYNRSETFKGSVTWLDIPTLTWKVSRITDVVPFTNLSGSAIGNQTLTGITAFAQLADDVRALCNFVPDNTYIPGYFMDAPGQDTTIAQQAAITQPAVDLGILPGDVFQTNPFQMTMSLLNPWGGSAISNARLRVTIEAPTAFVNGDVTAIAAADDQAVPFDVVGDDLVGWWGPETGFPVARGYNVSTVFNATIADTAPVGTYDIKLELVNVSSSEVLATDSGSINVNDNVATVLWGSPLPQLATQGTVMQIPVQVYSPAAGAGTLALRITGPDETLTPANLQVYGSNGTDMVRMSLSTAGAAVVGSWPVDLALGYTPVRWYVTVLEGAPVGNYAFGVTLAGGNTLNAFVVAVAAPESHGEQPPDSGEDTTRPVVTITPEGTLAASATFVLTADDVGVTFDCQLTKNGTVLEAWASCKSPKTYTGLQPGGYVFAARGTRGELVSDVVTSSWTVVPTVESMPPVKSISAVESLVPSRLLESRPGLSTTDGLFNDIGLLPAGTITAVSVTGRGGIADDADAVVLNITVTEPETSGYLTVFPCGTTRPVASNLNYTSGATVANAVIAKVGTNGLVCVYNQRPTHLVVDTNGYIPATSAVEPLVPARLLESRPGLSTTDGQFNDIGLRPAGTTTALTVTGRGGVADDADAVILNVTVTEPEAAGYLTVFPCGTTRPLASNLNYTAGATVANAVIAKVGTNGQVCIYNQSPTQLVVDTNGYIPAAG